MKSRSASIALIIVLCCVASPIRADGLRDAMRLLHVTNTASRFESAALSQTRDIIRTYASIVSMSQEVHLPQRIRDSIAACYAEVYDWERFSTGIARILAENLSQKELRLLTDFYSDRGLPPWEIDTFKHIISKADRIARVSADFIYANSTSCVDRDAVLIHEYLGRDRSPAAEPMILE